MLRAKLNKSLLAAQLALWLPLSSLFLPPSAPKAVPILLICTGWLLTPVFALWNLVNALRSLTAGAYDPWILRLVTRHKLAMLPAVAINALICFGAPLAFLNPWLFWLLPVAAIPIALSLFFTWLAALSSSFCVIAQAVHLWRNKTLTGLQSIGGIILQLIPAVDAAHCLALRLRHARLRHAPKSAPHGNQSQGFPAPGAAASSPPPPP